MKYIVITGNPVDGFEYHGPFDDCEQAQVFTEEGFRDVDWWIAELASPEVESSLVEELANDITDGFLGVEK